jgi:hypothetical protein
MRRALFVVLLIGSVLAAAPAASAIGGSRQCDFNNDGFDDAAIGVGGEAVGSLNGAGAVNVLYGSVDKLISIGDQLWTQDSPGLDDAAEAGDWFGLAVECGDFNNDSYADLVIASPLEDVGTAFSAGAVHLLFGSADGLTGVDSLFLHRDVPGVAGQAATNDRWGWSLAAGDFNGDGRDDLAVGSYRDDIGGVIGAGSVQVFYGFAGGLSMSSDKVWHRDRAGIKGVAAAGANFGWSLAAGDFDNNGYDDLAIGAHHDTVNTLGAAGSVSVIYGSTGGLTKAGDDLFHRGTPGIAGAPGAGDRFGSALAAGDFDNDGFDELAIGVPFDDVGSKESAGSVQVLRGGSNGLRTGGDKIWHRAKSGIRGAKGTNDFFGFSLTTGRFNSDGRDDLAIGVRNDNIGTVDSAGSVHVLYGSGSGLTAAGDQIWHQGRRGIAGANEAGDAYGYSVATGDFNGNGIDDLLIGIPNEDIQTIVDAGKVGVIYGRSGGLAAGGDQKWSQDSAGIQGVAEAGDYMGRNVNGNSN